MKQTYMLGSLDRSINGESDCNEIDIERHTGPNAWGYIIGFNMEGDGADYAVAFTNGTSVFITPDELADSAQYEVVTPEVMASRLKELQSIRNKWNADAYVPTVHEYDDALSIVI